MIQAIDNQMRQSWLMAGKQAIDALVHVHPSTFDQHIKPYCLLDSDNHPGRCMTMRWGGLYVETDTAIEERLALIQFFRKARAERPEDV